jgi:hypothetical protein
MVINNNGGNNSDAISTLIGQVMNRFDTNADGQLSGAEFTSLLSGLIGGSAGGVGGVGGVGGFGGFGVAGAFAGSGANFSQGRLTGSMHGVHGYDANNWGRMDSAKYRTAEFFRGMADREGAPVTINNIKRWTASSEFQSMYPGATFDGKDRLNFNGMVDPHSGATLREVDILLQADPSNPNAELGLWWHDLANDA